MMAAPALCTGCSGQFSRIARLFQVFQAFQVVLNCSKMVLEGSRVVLGGLDIHWMSTGCNWRSLDVFWHVWAVPGHLVLGKCWLATPVGTGSVKLMSRSRIDVVVVRE